MFDQYHDLSSPTISDFLPRTNNDLESLRPSLTMSKEKHNVSLIIGKPTVKRQKGRYLTITLQSLFECITSEHRVIEEILTVVMTADWTEERLVQGSIQCQDEVFGDTNSENEKHCWCSPISGQ